MWKPLWQFVQALRSPFGHPSVIEVTVPVVVVLVAEVKTDKETVLDTKDMVHSTTLLSQVAPSWGSSAVHKYLSVAEFLRDTWLLLCPVSTV